VVRRLAPSRRVKQCAQRAYFTTSDGMLTYIFFVYLAVAFTGALGLRAPLQWVRASALQGDVTIINADTKQTTVLPSGSPMSLGCTRTGLRLSFQCKQGTCSSCEFLLDGKVTRSCITKIPDKKSITIKAKPKK